MSGQINTEPVWMVLRYEPEYDRMWREIGCVNMQDPGAAFRHVVFGPPNTRRDMPTPGEYRVVRIDTGAHIAVEINLRDLDAEAKAVV